MPRIAEHFRDDGEAAAAELVKFGPAAENVTIAKARADADATTRLAALAVLNTIGTKASLPTAREAANADDPAVSAAAQQLWRKLTPDDVSAVDFALLDLGSTNPERLKRGLVALTQTKPDAHQRAVSRRLVELATESSEPPVQELAAKALLVWASRDAKDALITLVSPDADPAKRPRATALLSDLKETRAIPALCDCAARGTDWLQVSDALRRFGSDAEDGLIKLLRSDDRLVFTRACDLLRDVGTRKSLAPLGVIALNGDRLRSTMARDTAAEINRRLGTGIKP
jgi:HEAT repeat protein